ncbi:hypothetical protein [Fusibacter sp. JL216-2]|uniref:hypothetical protein n=1 Tax=Fusibacter sp. JL216-2 TaxID=3071453 RepID=UPI003D32C3C4
MNLRHIIKKLKNHPKVIFMILGLIVGVLFIGLIFMLTKQYFIKTEPVAKRYDKIKEITNIAKPQALVETQPDPEIEGRSKTTIKNRYLLFENMDMEMVEFAQNQLEDLAVFLLDLKEQAFDEQAQQNDIEAYFTTNQDMILKFLGEISLKEFEKLSNALVQEDINLTLNEDFTQLKGAGLVLFRLTSGSLEIECTLGLEKKTFISQLIKY